MFVEVETPKRDAALIVPPSIKTVEFEANPIEFPVAVPTLKIPLEILNKPVTAGEPVNPIIVALELFNQKPALAGIVYAAAANKGLLKLFEPSNFNKPLVTTIKPALFAPKTVSVPPGEKVRTLVVAVPLFKVTPATLRKLVTDPIPREKLALPAVVNVIVAPAVFVFVLKSIVPLFIKSPPTSKECVTTVPVAADLIDAAGSIVILENTVSAQAGVAI